MPPRPQRITPLNPKQKAAFWLGIVLAVLIIIVGWFITLREVVNEEVPFIQGQLDTALDGVVQELVELGTETQEGTAQTKHDVKLLLEVYQARLEGEPLDEALIEELKQTTSATDE
ncbi:hypothetical protein CO174_03670 [Candidatus Uhrbacteria bacterium CG_4_9_14_3_um_filter_50_9]|uniref:Uncharacterized protein n=1 Tax=Candidatus Uhrbacteria bacterium CG_4_9_14_3_um_filter_50_9 TaxID=1975035 RepID=A0A2M7XBS5_9BACT|nr:MAG: hypothetical protein CO174_03670 [Candidatus Uhrbacteria bacterium CG_4_9_14_3_um_filter_50_9]